jgi:hypothetical protein
MSGSESKSAKIKEIVPPKEIPAFHKPAPSGIFPTEQTKLMQAITGAINAFSRVASKP